MDRRRKRLQLPLKHLSRRFVWPALALFMALGGITTVLAIDTTSALYTANIQFLNLGLTRQNFATAFEISGASLVDDSFMAADTLNAVVHEGPVEIPSMPPNNRIVVKDFVLDDGGSFTDWQAEAQNATEVDFPLMPSSPQVDDAAYFGCDNPCRIITVNVGQEAASIIGDFELTWEYFNGTSFVTASNVRDLTESFTNAGVRAVSFDMPSDFAQSSITGSAVSEAFWVRARVTDASFTLFPQQALGTQAWYENGQWWNWGKSQNINQELLYNLSVGGPDLVTNHQIFPGARGITSSDSASIELGDTYTIHFEGAINFTAAITGTDVCIVCKDGAINLWLSGLDELTLDVTGAGATSISLDGIPDAVGLATSTAPHVVDIISDGTDVTLAVDGVGSATGTAQTVVDNANDYTWGRNQGFVFANTIYIMPDDTALAFELFDTEAEWDTGTVDDLVSTGGQPGFTLQHLSEASADDGQWSHNSLGEETGFNNTGTSTEFGLDNASGQDQTNAFYRFDGLRIPAGSTVLSANLVFTPFSANSTNTVTVDIVAVDEDDASAPSTFAAAEALARTTAVVAWTPVPSWVISPLSLETSPDISTVIQEVIDRPGWVEGNAIVMLVENNGSGSMAFRASCSFEAQCEATRLEITLGTGQTFTDDFIEMVPTAEDVGSPGFLADWTHSGASSRVEGLDSGSNSKARFGVKSMFIRAGTTVGTSAQVFQDIDASAGQVWSFGLNYARTSVDDDTGVFEITFRDAPGGTVLQTNSTTLSGASSSYQTASINNITAPSGTASIRVRAVVTCTATCGGASGIWLDGVMAAQDTVAPNWPDAANELSNSSFEQVFSNGATWESPTLNLTQTSVASSVISWDSFAPIDSEMSVFTSLNGGALQAATNNAAIPGISEGADVSGQTLEVTVVMTASSPDLQVFSPWNSFLAVLINDDILEDDAILFYQLRTTPGVTIEDLSPNANDGIMSYPVQASGLFSFISPLQSNRAPLSQQEALGVGDFAAPVTGSASNLNLFGQDDGSFLPGGEVISSTATETGIPVSFFWVILVLLGGVALGGVVWTFSNGSMLMVSIVLAGTLAAAAAVGDGIIPGWVPFVAIAMLVVYNVLRSRLPI